jgi:hypothetical protein
MASCRFDFIQKYYFDFVFSVSKIVMGQEGVFGKSIRSKKIFVPTELVFYFHLVDLVLGFLVFFVQLVGTIEKGKNFGTW